MLRFMTQNSCARSIELVLCLRRITEWSKNSVQKIVFFIAEVIK